MEKFSGERGGEKNKLMETEVFSRICRVLVSELHTLYADMAFGATVEEVRSVFKFKDGEKLPASRIVLDKIARIVGEQTISYTIKDLRELYDELTVGWEKFVAPLEEGN